MPTPPDESPGAGPWLALAHELTADLGSTRSLPGILQPRAIGTLAAGLHALLLHGPGDAEHAAQALASMAGQLERAIAEALILAPPAAPALDPAAVTRRFLEQLPELREALVSDARAAFRNDPSCLSSEEALLALPGPLAVAYHRMAHALQGLSVPLLPRLVSEAAHSLTGIDIHPGARIGREFFIDHGTGVVIGETARIGDRVTVYQGVTLGARSFTLDAEGQLVKGEPRHPIVEDDVVIYANASILGRVTIGRGSIIGGNVWLTRSVPAGTRLYQAAAQERGFEGGAGI